MFELEHTTTTVFSVTLLILVLILQGVNNNMHKFIKGAFVLLAVISSLSGFIISAMRLKDAGENTQGALGFNTAFGLILQLLILVTVSMIAYSMIQQ
jgi:uncharacterized membrane protein YhaH (DUF805 family)